MAVGSVHIEIRFEASEYKALCERLTKQCEKLSPGAFAVDVRDDEELATDIEAFGRDLAT